MKSYDSKYGIIGNLYHMCLKPYKIFKSENDFFKNYLHLTDADLEAVGSISAILKYDYLIKGFKEHLSVKFDETNEEEKERLNTLLSKRLSALDQKEILDIPSILTEIVLNSNSYLKYNPYSKKNVSDEDKYGYYKSKNKDALISLFEDKKDPINYPYYIYLTIFLAINKYIPDHCEFGPNYNAQLKEFNEKITCKYGVTSKPGVREIINLAKRNSPNLFALYEYADMLYYGSLYGPKQDIPKAFGYYKDLVLDDSFTHPLALWTLAYIYLNYHREKTELINCPVIPDIESLDKLGRIKQSFLYAQRSYSYTQNPAALNLMGKISQLTESEIPGIERFKKIHNIKTAEEYYELAAEAGYLYSYGNLAKIYLDKIFSEPNNEKEHLDKYLSVLKIQADKYDPWACNRLGNFYFYGGLTNPETGMILQFSDYPSSEETAYLYYRLAIDHYCDKNSGWAYANLLLNLPHKLSEDDIKSYIKELPKTKNYEAMDKVERQLPQIYSKLGYDNYYIANLLSLMNENNNHE